MTDDPEQTKQLHDAAMRLVGRDPSNTPPIELTESLDPDDDIYTFLNQPTATIDPQPGGKSAPTDGTTGDQS